MSATLPPFLHPQNDAPRRSPSRIIPLELWSNVVNHTTPSYDSLRDHLLQCPNEICLVLAAHHNQLNIIQRVHPELYTAVRRSDTYYSSLLLNGHDLETPRMSLARQQSVLSLIIDADYACFKFTDYIKLVLPYMRGLIRLTSVKPVEHVAAPLYFVIDEIREAIGISLFFTPERLNAIIWKNPGAITDLIRINNAQTNLSILSISDDLVPQQLLVVCIFECLGSLFIHVNMEPDETHIIHVLCRDQFPVLRNVKFTGGSLGALPFEFTHRVSGTLQTLSFDSESVVPETHLPLLPRLTTLDCHVTAIRPLLVFQQPRLEYINLVGFTKLLHFNVHHRLAFMKALHSGLTYLADNIRAPTLNCVTIREFDVYDIHELSWLTEESDIWGTWGSRFSAAGVDFVDKDGNDILPEGVDSDIDELPALHE